MQTLSSNRAEIGIVSANLAHDKTLQHTGVGCKPLLEATPQAETAVMGKRIIDRQ